MKIGYLIPEFPGQTHTFIWREISHLREWGVQVDIISTRPPSPAVMARHNFAQAAAQETYYLWPQSPIQLLSALTWAISKNPKGVWQMLRLCFTLKLDKKPAWKRTLPLALIAPVLAREAVKRDIQHLNSQAASNSAILGMMVKRLVGIPFSMVCNANLEWWGGAMFQKLSDAEFTVAVTDWLLVQMRSDYPTLRADQAIMAHHGVDTKRWKPRQDLDLLDSQGQSFQVITVGRLHHSKGHDVLIRSIKLLLDGGRKVNLKIVGAGPEESALKSLVQDLGLTEVVTFTGSLSEDQIIDLMHQSDAFALASDAEPLGVVYMEAMAAGIPAIGTNAGGVPEIISHREDGLLVPPQDETALAEALACLMDDPQLRQQLSQNGRRTIVERFDSRLGAATLYERLYGTPPIGIGKEHDR